MAGALLWSAPDRVYPIRAVEHGDVELADGFWRDRLEINRTSTLPALIRQGRGLSDSDLYKTIDAASYSLRRVPDAALSAGLDRLIDLIATVEEPDGHLYEAAIAHFEATGRRTLLDLALAHANRAAASSQRPLPGDGETELGLIRLFRHTGVPRYYDAARASLDQRGDARSVHGYAAMADVAGLEGDKTYRTAIDRIWRDTMSRRMTLTGEIDGETCAAAGNVFWNARMFYSTGNSAYLDVLERALYNDLTAGNDRCGPDRARAIARMPGYIYAYESETLFVNLYTGSRARVPMWNGPVTVTQVTNYPWDGDVRIRVEPAAPRMFTVAFRNPAWTTERPLESDRYRYAGARRLPPPIVEVNGTPFIDIRGRSGFITILREWKAGDEIRVRFQVPIRRVHEAGNVALERGPIVYALDAAGNRPGVRAITVDGVRVIPYFAAGSGGAIWIKR